MPIAPPPLVNEIACDLVMEKIDRLVMHQYTQQSSDVYEVNTNDTLNKAERDFIHQAYRDCGWSFVTSVTSEENGERPGLTMWRLVR